jgi:hypothetical protein
MAGWTRRKAAGGAAGVAPPPLDVAKAWTSEQYLQALTTVLAEAAKPHPAVNPKAVKQMIETARRGVNLKRHINQDEMLRVINPAMTELVENKASAGDILRRLKPQVQALVDQK